MKIKNAVIPGLLTVVLLAIIIFQPFKSLININFDIDSAAYDVLKKMIPGKASDSVVVVGIDEESINQVGPWPWSRSVLARCVNKILIDSPSVIAFDMFLPTKTDDSVGNSQFDSALSGNHVVLPFRIGKIVKTTPTEISFIPLFVKNQQISIITNKTMLDNATIYSAIDLESIDTAFTDQIGHSGFLNISTSKSSRVVREVIHLVKVGDTYLPSLAVATVAAHYGIPPQQIALDGKPALRIGDRQVPITAYGGSTFLNFRGKSGSIPTVSAAKLLGGQIPPGTFKHKIVCIGITAPSVNADFFFTPMGSMFPGVEVWATAILDILYKSWVIDGDGIPLIFNGLLCLLIFPGMIVVAGHKKTIAVVCSIILVLVSCCISILVLKTTHYFWNPVFTVYACFFLAFWMLRKR